MSKSDEQDAWERASGFVYFIAAGDVPVAIKIGISKRQGLRRRLRTLQGANHEPLCLLAVIPCIEGERPMVEAQRLESELHCRFRHLQRFEKGWAGSEWFTADGELLAFIGEVGRAPEEFGLVSSIARLGPGLERP